MATPTFATMLADFAKVVPALGDLVKGVMFLAGILLVFRAIYAFKQYGELRTMMSVNADLKTPIILLFIGISLILYPSLAMFSLDTIYGKNGYNLVAYVPNPNWQGQTNQMVKDLGTILRLIGYIAFFRGWMILTHLTNQGAQPGTFAKAMTHIIGGILLVNIFGTWNIIKNTLGFYH